MFSRVGSSVAARQHPRSLTLSLPPRHTVFCSLAATLLSSESLSCRFLGDLPSPVLSSEPWQGQIPEGSFRDRARLTTPRPSPYSKMGLGCLCLIFLVGELGNSIATVIGHCFT